MLSINVKKSFADFELTLSVDIAPAFTALFGPSGAGKTTTLNLIAGLLSPSEGEIALDDRSLFSGARRINLPPQKRGIGYIFQESRLFPHMTVKENLLFSLHRTPRELRRFAFSEIVAATGLTALIDRSTGDLSGGEKQRVALARALLASPSYLLMDEPLAALDLPTKLSFLNFLKQVHHQLEIPILYVSHDLVNVLNFADSVVLLQEGKGVGYGSPHSLLEKLHTTPLLSREDVPNIFEVTVASHDAVGGTTGVTVNRRTLVLPHLRNALGEKLLLNIPASEIILALDEPKGLSASNVFAGNIEEIYQIEERVLVDVDVGLRLTVEIVPATVERLRLKTGKRVYLIIKASSFRRLV